MKSERVYFLFMIAVMLQLVACASGPEPKGIFAVSAEDAKKPIEINADDGTTMLPNSEGYHFLKAEGLRGLLIAGDQPHYPPEARDKGYMADLSAQLFFKADGSFEKIKFSKTSKHFEDAVRKAVSTWKIRPVLLDGKPVPVFTIYKFGFKVD